MDRVFRIFDAILLATAMGALAVAAYFITADTVTRSTINLAAFVIVPLVFSLGVIGTFKLPAERRAGIALILIFSGMTLYVIELWLVLDPLGAQTRLSDFQLQRRRMLGEVRELRAQGKDAYPIVPSQVWMSSPLQAAGVPVVPLAGVANATIVECNESDDYVTFHSDRFGFNNPSTTWRRHASTALVGDSFVEGWCVPTRMSFASRIRNERPGTLNAGYSGDGPLVELATLREYVAPRAPKHVFWFFFEGNDLVEDLPRELRSDVLKRYLDDPGFRQDLPARATAIERALRRAVDSKLMNQPRADDEATSLRHRALAVLRLQSLRERLGLRLRPSPQRHVTVDRRKLDTFARILQLATREVRGWGGTLHFVYLPTLQSFTKNDRGDHSRVVAIARSLDLPVVDMYEVFSRQPNPLSLFPFEGKSPLAQTVGLHYDEDGHRLVAQEVLARLDV